MTRYCVVRGQRRVIERYLPDNYTVVFESFLPDGKSDLIVAGEDVAGWTLDGYVIPRLASGLYFAREYASYGEANEAAAAAMN